MADSPTLTPRAGTGGVSLRLAPRIEAATRLGILPEGARLELEAAGSDWHTGRVYVARSVAETIENQVRPQSTAGAINIRSKPQIDPNTDVGDLLPNQQLELIAATSDWYVGRVYVSAQFTDIIQPDQAVGPIGPAVPQGSPLTPAELQALSLTPAQRRSAPAGAAQPAVTAARIWNKYGGVLEPLANQIGLEPGVAVAVVAVESGGSGFGADGRMIIRFENHLFWFNWGQANAATFNQFFQFDQAVMWRGHKFRVRAEAPWQDVHVNQAGEWAAFAQAQALADQAARKSISMGLVQILGSNHRAIGYDTVDAMFEAFSADERYQLLGFFNFVKNDQRQVNALRAGDFTAFARIYNGPGQPQFYGDLIKGVFDGFKTLQAA